MSAGTSLDPALCRRRQQRVREILERLDLDRALLGAPEYVQYLTGFRPHRLMAALVCVERDGLVTLVAPNVEPEGAAADRVLTFAAQQLATLCDDQRQRAVAVLRDVQPDVLEGRVGVEYSVSAAGGYCLEAELLRLRRCKDADELALIRRAIECTDAMYARARAILRPGVSELEVYNELHAAAVEVAGEPLTALGNDFQCNSPGGAPRRRRAESGELYILDLGPAYRGYYADNCRTFAVDGRASSEQQEAWARVVAVLDYVENTVRPGVACRELFVEARSRLDAFLPGAFIHHLGHGIGLYPHETPRLNPHWNDVFQEGDVFTVEPGLYGESLRAGIRLEQNYVVTSRGVERLTQFPLDL